MVILPIEMIVSNPTVRGGRPIIVGTRVRVQDVAAAHVFEGMSADELAAGFALTVGQVYAALAYYYAHKADFAEQWKADDLLADQMHEELSAKGRIYP
ncbi:MAG: hypothetical protein UZ13_00486 [Chloroflexi bacterium OLB13]|nr:MAG: hypothetical protein UZ13_00486 [Chloroflexi bacterium OLB13]GIK29896.1 MAG: hypothetical protein BroJett007_30340 [Chloroflexota bacterium]